jgi:carboxypeptidase family protein/TonB-dependent receptor-like protein
VSLRRIAFFAAALLSAAVSRPTVALAQSDVIRGRIIGPDSVPIERATVTVTSLNGNITRSARTDKAGRYQIVFPGDEGDYMVNVAALGFAARKFEIKRTGDQEILVADAKLLKSATQLDAVKVQAQRDKPIRDDNRPDIGGSERLINGSAISADQLGDLAALASSLPGVQLVPSADGGPNGFSVLGLGADQNSMTLNGMPFGSGNIPRDANVSTSLSTSPYDVSRGNFSGGMLSIRTGRASNFIVRSGSANIDAPKAQWTDAAGRALHQQYANISAGGLFAGPIQSDKSFFNLSYQLGRRQSDLQSLLNTDPIGLQTAGLAPDSVRRLLNILGSAHIPQTVSGVPKNRYTDQALILGSFDVTPPSSTTGQAFNVTYNASLNRTSAVSMVPTELPSHSGDRTNYSVGLQGRHTNYFGFLLSETSLGISQNKNYGTPYLDLPSGNVRINSTFADGTPSVQNIGFGGNPAMNTSVKTTGAMVTNMLSWVSENNKHRIKLGTEFRRDQYAQDLTTNQLGTFNFNSLADLEAGRPATFSRQLSPRTRSESEYIGALSLGDSYRHSSDLQVTYGVRLDGNRFTSEPAVNPDVEKLLGVSNDNVPNRFYLSPRLGFSWTYGAGPQVGGFDGAFRGPRATLRGGIGMFQNTPNVASIGSAMDNTGLPSAVQQLACVGLAAPSPDWAAYMANAGAIPATCANGTTGTVFSNTAPNVTMFDKDYVSPRSLRSNLQWQGPMLGNRFSVTADLTYSLNLNQGSTYDLNFRPNQQFALSNEGGRPVYAQATSIVPTTGAIATSEARVTNAYSHVSELKSDMKSEAKQLTVSVSPMSFSSVFGWGLSYVYANTREQYRGFTSTSGSPLDVAWGRSPFDSRHQVQYRLTWNAFDYIRIGWNGSFRSGTPYTPTVAGDINGDGYGNDRAFVFDPSKTTDAVLASGMQSLLANGSSGARDCLNSQMGKVAERNACQGPWTTTANLTFSFNPIKVRMPQRATVSFQLSNPLSAADMLLHGENGMHGWGQSAFPSGQLLFVRGFDAATQRYKYEVNQRFGATAISQTIFRNPVVLTTMLRFDVGPTRERQALTQMLDRGRTLNGQKMPEPALKAFGPIGITNPMAQILRQADTLELTPQQADSIAVLNRGFTLKLDSIWTPTAKYLAALPDKYDQDEAYDHYRRARETSVDALMKIAPAVKGLLTADQMRKLPTFITPFLDRRYLASVRSGTAGTGLGMIMGGMAIPGGAATMFGGGGGGAGVTMIKIGTP